MRLLIARVIPHQFDARAAGVHNESLNVTHPMKRNIVIGVGVVLLAAAVFFANRYYQQSRGPEVQVEAIEHRTLTAVVSASGKIQPKRLVNISADTMGRVTELAVYEGEQVDSRPVPDAHRPRGRGKCGTDGRGWASCRA